MAIIRFCSVLLLSLSLAACGGGGGGGSDDSSRNAQDDIPSHNVVANVIPAEGGQVNGAGEFNDGESVRLTAIANEGYRFKHWSDQGQVVSADPQLTFTAKGDRQVSAEFALLSYEVTIQVSDETRGSVQGAGNYDHGESVVLAATATDGSVFAGWEEVGALLKIDDSFEFTAQADRQLTARFVSAAELLNGRYDGDMKSSKTVFGVDQTYTTILVEGDSITFTQDHFLGETCIFSGAISNATEPFSASGSYECSDFTEGSWSSSKIYKAAPDSMIAELTVGTGSGTYTAKYSGFLEDDDVKPWYTKGLYYLYTPIDYTSLAGTYDGALKSGDDCAGHTFEISNSDTSIDIADDSITITQDAFFEGVCIFTGSIVSTEMHPLHAQGEFECSNFDEGVWSSDYIAATGTDSIIAELMVEVPARGCSYTVTYAGFK